MAANPVETVGVAKVVQLGADKVLIVELKSDAPEGEYVIKAIEAIPTGPGGAGICGIRSGKEA